MNFKDWYEARTDKHLIDYTSSKLAFEWVQSRGIAAHEGQKLLVQFIIDNDKSLSEDSRTILETLIGE